MHFKHAVVRPLPFAAFALLVAISGCSKPVERSGKTADTAQAMSAPRDQPGAKLGDLTPFRTIAGDVAVLVDKGDLVAAKARIKDLELSWDAAEAGLKPRDASDWHLIDDAIDKALSALRAGTPSKADCKAAMANLLKTFDTVQSKG
jgi:hypothetical protein